MSRLGMFREVSGDFDHRRIELGNASGPHALYRI